MAVEDSSLDGAARTRRVPIIISEDHFALLMEIGLRSLTTGGKRMTLTAIVRASISALAEMNIDFTAIRDEDDLKERIINSSKAPETSIP